MKSEWCSKLIKHCATDKSELEPGNTEDSVAVPEYRREKKGGKMSVNP